LKPRRFGMMVEMKLAAVFLFIVMRKGNPRANHRSRRLFSRKINRSRHLPKEERLLSFQRFVILGFCRYSC